jgi:hypothetical protein
MNDPDPLRDYLPRPASPAERLGFTPPEPPSRPPEPAPPAPAPAPPIPAGPRGSPVPGPGGDFLRHAVQRARRHS